ncbi:MAG: hypothetical protein KA184_09745 [Candidatus Hydrogenedentes bacterium]|nr:hypothetical protein [Candidatus Hydrogenedentota bacterium]
MKSHLLVTVFMVGASLQMSGDAAAADPALQSTRTPLDGPGWVMATDPANTGREEDWFKQPAADATPAEVPNVLQEVFPGYHGVAWYWRTLSLPPHPAPGGRYLLRFWAVDYFAEVWLNGVPVGSHEGAETPFTLDVTGAARPSQDNLLAVRVVNPGNEPIDGMVLAEIPHRNKNANLTVGGSYNYGGITEPVELLLVPSARITDAFVRPGWQTGKVQVTVDVFNASAATEPAVLEFTIAPAPGATAQSGSAIAVSARLNHECPSGASQLETELTVPHHRLWDLHDPCLYRLAVRLTASTTHMMDEFSVRFGFRDFRVEHGFFHLNGRRIFLRSSHTGNHCPIGQIRSPRQAPDLLRKDLVHAKASGFNMVRFIAGLAHPYQLDLCDELGLMVYEETLAGWCLADSPQMATRFDGNIREAILRDRNHPCLTIFGLLNETADGPVFRRAVDALTWLRALDDTRLVLLNSGRWDGQFSIGSGSNPGSTQWECFWGVESPDRKEVSTWGRFGGYFTGAGDAHVYPETPHTPEVEQGIRTLGADTKPVFLSEYGIGSLMNAIQELRTYEQVGADPAYDDVKYFQNTVDRFTADWTRFGMDEVYAFPEDMLEDSQRLHCRQRLLGFNLIRSNPRICGYNLTGLLDHGFTGEGLWTYWREWKPGIVDALRDGWAPLRWCLFVSPMHGCIGRTFKIEAILANENVLAPGEYPVTLRIMGPEGLRWEHKATLTVPVPPAGEDGPLAIPVAAEEVTIPSGPGKYTFAANLDRGGAAAGGRLDFYLSESLPIPASETGARPRVTLLGLDGPLRDWLEVHGVDSEAFSSTEPDAREVILVGDIASAGAPDETRAQLLTRMARGSIVVFLTPHAFQIGDNPVAGLPLKSKGRMTSFPDWLYHKECVAKRHAFFAGMQAPGIMDWDYYGPVISHMFLEDAELPEEVIAAAFALCHSSRPDGYAAGVMMGRYRFGEGAFILNTFNIIDNIDRHPAAGLLVLNIVQDALARAQTPLAPLPADFDDLVREIAGKS